VWGKWIHESRIFLKEADASIQTPRGRSHFAPGSIAAKSPPQADEDDSARSLKLTRDECRRTIAAKRCCRWHESRGIALNETYVHAERFRAAESARKWREKAIRESMAIGNMRRDVWRMSHLEDN
jgi:hypothetical protein